MSVLAQWQRQIAALFRKRSIQPDVTTNLLMHIPVHHLELFIQGILIKMDEILKFYFPYTCKILNPDNQDSEQWDIFTKKFILWTPNLSYDFLEAMSAFPDFLKEDPGLLSDYPYIQDLASFEWLAMKMRLCPDPEPPENLIPEIPSVKDFSNYIPHCNPINTLYQTKFPILDIITSLEKETLQVEYLENSSEEQNILLYRDPKTLECQFFSFNDRLTKNLYLMCRENTASYAAIIETIYKNNPDLWEYPIEKVQHEVDFFLKEGLDNSMFTGSLPVNTD